MAKKETAKEKRTIAALEQRLAATQQELAAGERAWKKLDLWLLDFGRRMHKLECEHTRKQVRVYAAHSFGTNVAHLVTVTCLDCEKVLIEEPNAVEVTGV